MGDLPDWTQATSNAGTVLESGTVTSGQVFDIDVSNNNSLVIDASGFTSNTKIVLTMQWFTDSTKAFSVNNQTITSMPFALGNSFVGFETPVYGGYLEIINNSGQSVTLTIIGASRTVVAPRMLNSTAPSRNFVYSGAFTSGTPVDLPESDTGPFGYNSNAQSTVTASATVNGTLVCTYVQWSGVATTSTLFAITAGMISTATLALPQGVVGFRFTPGATAGAGLVAVNAAPAQL